MAKNQMLKVTVEVEIYAKPGDIEGINEEIRDALTTIIDDECPTDLEGVTVHDLEDEDEE